jgi:hypothetical protein
MPSILLYTCLASSAVARGKTMVSIHTGLLSVFHLYFIPVLAALMGPGETFERPLLPDE